MGHFFSVWHKYMIPVDENEIGVMPHSLKQLMMACKFCDLVRDHHTCMHVYMTLCYHGSYSKFIIPHHIIFWMYMPTMKQLIESSI